jgi:hypothetical protein
VALAIELPVSYLRAFLDHGVPPALPNRVRRRLAHYLGIPGFSLSE